MIKINLLPSRVVKKKKGVGAGGGQLFIILLLLLLAGEGVGLYFWYDSVQTDLIAAQKDAKGIEGKVQALQKVRTQIDADEKAQTLLEEQNAILERLKDGKSGPPNMLLFLAYALSDPPDTLANQDELKALQKAGWNLQWDADSVWLTELDEDEYGTLTLRGEARSHEDVAEFYQRLRSSIYFRNLVPGPQERKYDQGIEMKYVAFKGEAELNYRLPDAPPKADAAGDAAAPDGPKPDGPKKDAAIVPGTPSVEAVPGAAGASAPKHQGP
jgi:Tfp pilus assembly protein PilN